MTEVWLLGVFLLNIFISSVVTVYVVLYPAQWIVELMELRMPPSYLFRALVVIVAVVNFFLSFVVEVLKLLL